ncbi:speckle-type POZ protein-like [Planococcus citri]|uniref:speckle-type POZ protein-like n=1 Tax=Planococcus citri TaxID=170843 RepID=UPI0031F94E28
MSQSTSAALDSKAKTTIPENHCLVDVKWGKISYLWTIKHFHQFHCEVKEILESTKFTVSTHPEYKWFLRLLIKNSRPENADYFGLFLCLDSTDADTDNVLVKAKLSLLDDKRNDAFFRQISIVYGEEIEDWGYSGFITKKKLLDTNPSNKLLVDDTLTILCEGKFAVANSASYETVEWRGTQSTTSESNLPKSLGRLLRDQDLVDVTFSVNGKNFGAHKSILAARSPVFAAMFTHDMKETRLNQVNISDMTPEIFEAFLRYMYTDETPDVKMVRDLLVAAEKYNVDSLKLLCEEMILKNLSLENATDVLVFADLHRAEQLKKHVMFYIKTHPTNIMSTQSWKSAILTRPHLFDDVNGVNGPVAVSSDVSVAESNETPAKKRRKKRRN